MPWPPIDGASLGHTFGDRHALNVIVPLHARRTRKRKVVRPPHSEKCQSRDRFKLIIYKSSPHWLGTYHSWMWEFDTVLRNHSAVYTLEALCIPRSRQSINFI